MKKLSLAAFAAGAILCFALPSAQAAPPVAPTIGKSLMGASGIEKVQAYRRSCRRWNRECRARWGWGWPYRRCMRLRGC